MHSHARLILILLAASLLVIPVLASNTTAYDPYLQLVVHGNYTPAAPTTLYDDSPYHVTITSAGGALPNTTQKVLGNASVYLDGTGDYYNTPVSGRYNSGTGNFTWSFMFNPYDSASQTNKVIFINYLDTNNYYYLNYASTRMYYEAKTGGVGSGYYYTDALSWTNNQSYHIVIERTGSGVSIWRDGTPLPITQVTAISTVSPSGAIYIGHDPRGTYGDLRGYVDEFAYWNSTAIPIWDLYPMPEEIRTEQILLSADYTANVTAGLFPLPVEFNGTFTGTTTPDAFNWTINGDSASTSRNFTHTFHSGGNYTINFTATAGGISSSKEGYVEVWNRTTAAFSANVTSGPLPLAVKFTDASSNATAWYWEFGDGNTSVEQSPEFVYTFDGVFSVNLKANNSVYDSDWENKTAYIDVSSETTPIAISSISRATIQASWYTWFNDTSLNTPTAWCWTFQDGTFAATANGTKRYTRRGIYNISSCPSNGAGSNCSYNLIRVI